MTKSKYEKDFQASTAVSLKSLEAKNWLLDKINSEIIKAKIDLNSTHVNLTGVGITRLPVSLFHLPAYVNFWENLSVLSCKENQLTTLNVHELVALKVLWCYNNQLTTLNVQGLAALQILLCENNHLTTLNLQGLTALQQLACHSNELAALNVQGLSALQWLTCHNNPLKKLNLTGVHVITKDRYAELERGLLFNQLNQWASHEARQTIIARLGADYTYKNCLYYCGPIYAATLFAAHSASGAYGLVSSALTRASAFLPSFSFSRNNTPSENTDHKRKSPEEEIEREFSAGEDGKSPLKKIKKASQE